MGTRSGRSVSPTTCSATTLAAPPASTQGSANNSSTTTSETPATTTTEALTTTMEDSTTTMEVSTTMEASTGVLERDLRSQLEVALAAKRTSQKSPLTALTMGSLGELLLRRRLQIPMLSSSNKTTSKQFI